jgi:tetratricopeptide (TPR) repeat protein
MSDDKEWNGQPGPSPYKITKVTAPVEKRRRPHDAQLEKLLDVALRLHRQGNLPDAELIYREILRQDFNHADAWHLLGVLTYQSGYHEVARELIAEAIAIEPQDPVYHNNLGNVHRELDDPQAALQAYDKALSVRPDYFEAHVNRGTTLRDLGRFDKAIDAYRTALRLQPDDHGLLNDLAGVLRQHGELAAAVACYRQALAIRPSSARLHLNLGLVLEESGDMDAAMAAYRRAAELEPAMVEAHDHLRRALKGEQPSCGKRA